MLRTQSARRIAKMLIDAVLAPTMFMAALALRLDGEVIDKLPPAFAPYLPFVLVGLTLALPLGGLGLGLYRSIWRYTSVREVGKLLLTSGLGAGLLVALRLADLVPVSGSVAVIFGVLYFAAACAVRLARRLAAEQQSGGAREDAIPVLFVGAGRTANALLNSLRASRDRAWKVVGLLDDNPIMQRMQVQGYPVLGPTTELERVIEAHHVRHVVVAMPRAKQSVANDLLFRARRLGVTVQMVPLVSSLLRDGRSPASVTLQDLVDSSEVKRTLLPHVAHRDEANTILVTGGAGYIGSHLVRKLLARGHRVRVLDNFTYGAHALTPMLDHPNLEVVEGDISSIRDVVSVVKDVNTVIALAAIVGDPACGLNAEETLNLNYESTKVLVEACNFYGVKRLVFASSCSVYGASDGDAELDETSTLNPVSLYARTRILSEQVIFDRAGDVVPVILRLSTVFGYSDRMRFDLVVNTLTARAVVDGSFQVFGGSQWRPFVHCQDAAEAFLLAALAPAEQVNRQIFNVGSRDMNYTIADVGQIVREEVGDHVEVQIMDDVDDARNYRVSFEKIAHVLGFQRSYDLRTGIREMVTALEGNDELQDYRRSVYSNVEGLRSRGAVDVIHDA